MLRSTPSLLVAVALATFTAGCVRPDAAATPHSGSVLYRSCDSCHGKNGEGNQTIAAPPIAGLPAWYVEAQLVKFRSGHRGYHPDDTEGLRMRPMSRQMMSPGEVATVAAYVAALPKITPTSVLDGDAQAGQASYATCLACHGPTGQGNETLKSPPLTHLADWYILSQLKKFKAGHRGANPADITGNQMRPMAMTLADETAMKNVIAHIKTFPR